MTLDWQGLTTQERATIIAGGAIITAILIVGVRFRPIDSSKSKFDWECSSKQDQITCTLHNSVDAGEGRLLVEGLKNGNRIQPNMYFKSDTVWLPTTSQLVVSPGEEVEAVFNTGDGIKQIDVFAGDQRIGSWTPK